MVRLVDGNEAFVKLSFLVSLNDLDCSAVSSGISTSVCSILVKSIEDADPIVKLMSLESVVDVNKNEILRNCFEKYLRSRPQVSTSIADYFNGHLHIEVSSHSQDIFSQDVVKGEFTHRCVSATLPANDSEPPVKKIKTSDGAINGLIAKNKLLYKEIKRCLDDTDDANTLNPSQKLMLSDLITQYQQLQAYL